MKPQELACYGKVEKAIGTERAMNELQKIIDQGNETLCIEEEDVLAFVCWSSTPQGTNFWSLISREAGE